MKKLFLSLVVVIMAATASYAQSSQVATLTHEGTITTYYGANGFIQAYNASTDGDIITLSSGVFNSGVTITKNITIRGAGMEMNYENAMEPTYFLNALTINIPSNTNVTGPAVDGILTMEGMYFKNSVTINGNLFQPFFSKCRFSSFYENGSATITNANFLHCKIGVLSFSGNGSASIINSFVNNYSYNGDKVQLTFLQCCLKGSISNLQNGIFTNCIIVTQGINTTFLSSNTIKYCIGINSTNGTNYNIFMQVPDNSTDIYLGNDFSIFESYRGQDDIDSEQFQLTEDAKATYKDNEGNEIGMYGGAMPYTPVPSNPRITKCNVAAKSTVDGKLSVDIEVSTPE